MWPFKKKKKVIEYTDEERKIIDRAKEYNGVIKLGTFKNPLKRSS